MGIKAYEMWRLRIFNAASFVFILLWFCIAALRMDAQKYDHSWLLGYLPNDSSERFGGTLLTFGEDTIFAKFHEITFYFDSNAQICDPNGQLKLVSNGCDIYNGKLEKINSEPLGYNEVYQEFCSRGYPVTQGLLILPDLYNPSKYFLFRNLISNDYIYEAILYWELNEIESEKFEISAEKRLIEDEVADQITATQHGNGKDWWLITPKAERGYYITRIGPNGPERPRFQDIGIDPPDGWTTNCCAHACFSPDGNTYVSGSRWRGVRVFDFDRCEGRLSNPRYIPLDRDSSSVVGVAISPNNRWLYVALGLSIFQYDLQSKDIATSGIKVAEYDGHTAPLWTTFYQMVLTPNDRIVVSSTNTVYEFTQIINPDDRGPACNVQQHSLKLKTIAQQQLPNFPNFRAGRLIGSPCDTLLPTRTQPQTTPALRLYPNPASEFVNVDIPGGFDRLELLDLHGRLVLDLRQQQQITIHRLPEGVYTVRAWNNRKLVGINKLVVLR